MQPQAWPSRPGAIGGLFIYCQNFSRDSLKRRRNERFWWSHLRAVGCSGLQVVGSAERVRELVGDEGACRG